MPIHRYVVVYTASLLVFLILDFIWLGWAAQAFYHNQLGALLSEQVVWPAALGFYCMYIIGLVIFCVAPALRRNSLINAMVMGGLYGFFTYATYELTNFALIRDWPAILVPVDIGWGVVLCTAVSASGYLVGKRVPA